MQRPNTPDGLFIDGNPATGLKGTPITAAWLNALIAVGAFLSGTTVPDPALGGPGDYYLRTDTNTLYGPKTTVWPGTGTLLVGPPGIQGATGLTGNPYKSYATKALATADLANIPADALVWINADATPANIGYWAKTGGVLVQSPYDRVAIVEARTSIIHDTQAKNKFDKTKIVNGLEVFNDGSIRAQVDSTITPLIMVSGQSFVTVSGLPVNAGSDRYYVFYAKDAATIVGTSSLLNGLNAGTLTVPVGAYWLVFSVKQRISGTGNFDTVQFEYGAAMTAYEAYTINPTVRFIGLKEVYSPSPAVTTVTNGAGGKNLFDLTALIPGIEVYGDGTIHAQTDSSTTDYIYVKGYPILYISGLSANPLSARYYVFLGADKTTIVGTGSFVSAVLSGSVVIPSNAYWFRISPKQRNAAVVAYSTIQIEFGTVATVYEAFIQGIIMINGKPFTTASSQRNPNATSKTFIVFGDSISETATTADGGTYTEGTRSNWPTFAKAQLAMASMKNYAKSGAAYRDNVGTGWQQISHQISQAAIYGGPADCIIIAAGTNDGIGSLGDYATAMGKANLADLDRTLLYEALRWAFWSIRANWPSAVCFAALPIQRASTTTTALTTLYAAIKAMANDYNFKIIDATFESGIVKQFEVNGAAGLYLSDGLHPNTAGQQLMANLICQRINNAFNY